MLHVKRNERLSSLFLAAVNTLISHLYSHYSFLLKVKGKADIAFHGNPISELGRHLPHGITQCYLPPDTSERAPRNPGGTLFTYPGGMEGCVDLVDSGRESNPGPFDHESDAEPLHHCTAIFLYLYT